MIINYPAPAFKTRQEDGKDFIFDALRKKWILLTPEEWVRQNFIQYLLQEKKYPASLIAIEKEMQLGELKKRFDVLIYNKDHQPSMMVECKAPAVPLDSKVLEQILRYTISIPVAYIVITNGEFTYAWQKIEDRLDLLQDIPVWAG